MKRILHCLLFVLVLLTVQPSRADVVATFDSATDVPVIVDGFSARGTFSATLNFAPPTGTNLMAIKNTGLGFINGTFDNLAHGQEVVLSYGGINYRFTANYFGGTGNDLVLQWGATRLVAWGYNSDGRVGDNSGMDRLVPENVFSSGVLSGKTIISLSVGGSHSLALCSDGTIAAWGSSMLGQLGSGSTTYSPVPVAVSTEGVLAGKTIISVAAGENHTLALCSDGTVAAWGYNAYGQLGNNSTTNSSLPVAVNTSGVLAGKTVVAVAAGSYHSVALCSDGTVVAWGAGSAGGSGNNRVPVAVNSTGVLSGKTVISVVAGGHHNLALCSDGTVAAWGANGRGQLGTTETFDTSIPVAVNTAGTLSGKTVVAVAAGYLHSLALCSDGTIASWGANSNGQLGINSTTQNTVPVRVVTSGALSGKTVIALAAGEGHSLALCSDGTSAAWGANSNGQLGNNSTTQSTVPVAVSSSPLKVGQTYTALCSGTSANHCLGLVALPPLPTVADLAAMNRTRTSATLTGTVFPNGSPATAKFEYGTTISYGSSVSALFSPNDGMSPQSVSATLTNLTPGTTYHYRLTATNALSTVSTTDGTFTTSRDVSAIYNSASDVPITASNFSAGGATFSATLNFAPPTGTNLTVVRNTGSSFIHGTFNNLNHGEVVVLSFGGINYRFVANYYGGTGNDLVLQWAKTRVVAWGENISGQIGDGTANNSRYVPTNVLSTGALFGRTIIAQAAGGYHSLALCSDGTVVSWGQNVSGQLGDNSTTQRTVPVVVNTEGALFGKTVVAVAAGRSHSLALCSDGTVAAWGDNQFGQLGDGGTTYSRVPVAVNASGVLAGKMVIAIAANWSHSLALCSDGTIVAWGNNASGQLGDGGKTRSSVPVNVDTAGLLFGKTVISIAAGSVRNVALCSDGTVLSFGGSAANYTVPTVVSSTGALLGKTVVALAAGDFHHVALCSDGSMAAWGNNNNGQLGNNSTTDSSVPVGVTASGVLFGKKVVTISAGRSHCLAQCSDGTVVGWGDNFSGQLGDNSTINSPTPVAVSSSPLTGGEVYVGAVSGSYADHNLALIASPPFPVVAQLAATNVVTTSATLNGVVDPNGSTATAYFEYGLDTSYGSRIDVTLSPNDGISAQNVSADISGLIPGAVYHYRLTAVNAVSAPSTTDGSFITSINVTAAYNSVADVPVTDSYISVAGGTFNATLNFAPITGTNLMVLKNTGQNFINGTLSNLAHGQDVILSYGGIDYRFVANYYGGTGNDLVLQWAGTRLAAWGLNSNGQLGNGGVKGQLMPVGVLSTGVLSGKTVVAVAAGGTHSLALCSDGTVAAWGLNSSGQLGNNSTSDSLIPVAVNTEGVLSGKTVVAVAAGSAHSLALCSDGTVAAWGSNSSGRLGDSSTTNRTTPVPVYTEGVLSGKMVVAVAAGSAHSLALCSDGTVAAWGANSSGQLGDGNTMAQMVPVRVSTAGVLSGKTVVAVAAGSAHNLALCSDGRVAAWGANSSGQLGNSSTTIRMTPSAVSTTGVLAGKTVTAVAAGGNHSLALCTDGTLAAWGDNLYGQLGNYGTTIRTTPGAVDTTGILSGKTVAAVAAGSTHSLALCIDGTLAAWGRNSSGQLGNGSTMQSTLPLAVSGNPLAGGERYAAVFSGSSASHNLGVVASPPAPVVTTLAVTNLSSSSVTLNGTVNDASGNASVFFDYGLDISYGSTAIGSSVSIAGSTVTPVAADVINLTPNTTFHYRVRATNAGGTTNGADLTFTTPPDTTSPIGGTMTLLPASPVDAGCGADRNIRQLVGPEHAAHLLGTAR